MIINVGKVDLGIPISYQIENVLKKVRTIVAIINGRGLNDQRGWRKRHGRVKLRFVVSAYSGARTASWFKCI